MVAADGESDLGGESSSKFVHAGVVDQDFDADVARFLLSTEFFAGADEYDSAVTSPIQSANEDMLFTDFMNSFDMPDLELGDAREPTLEHFAMESEMAGSSTLPPAAATSITSIDSREVANSLQVLLSPSTLATSSPTAYQRHTNPQGEPGLRPPPMSKKPRKRVKDELEYLRHQVTAFEAELVQLKERSRERLDSSIGWSTNSISGSWEGVAKRQDLEKQKATMENLRLKETLKSQLQLARILSKLLESRQDLHWLESPQLGHAMNNDESVFAMLTTQIEILHGAVDTVLNESRQTGPNPSVRSDAEGRAFIEFDASSVLPFDFRTTASAMWTQVTTPSSINLGGRQYRAISSTVDSARARLSMRLRLRHQDSQIEMNYVGKRFIEADRVVIVWCSISDAQSGLLLISGEERVRVRECGWSVMTATSASVCPMPISIESGTVMQTITRITPELRRSGASEPSMDHIGLLTNAVLALNQQNLAALHLLIENKILRDAVEL